MHGLVWGELLGGVSVQIRCPVVAACPGAMQWLVTALLLAVGVLDNVLLIDIQSIVYVVKLLRKPGGVAGGRL